MTLSLAFLYSEPTRDTIPPSSKIDTPTVVSTIKVDSLFNVGETKVKVSQLGERLQQVGKGIVDTSKIKSVFTKKANNLKAFAKSLLPKEYFKIGSVQIQSNAQFYFSNAKERPRGFAQNFVRYDINSNVQILGLPFDVRVFFSTANGGPAGNLSGITLNFDYQQLLANVKASLMQQLEKERKESEQDLKQSSLGLELSNLRGEINKEASTFSSFDIKSLTKNFPSSYDDFKYQEVMDSIGIAGSMTNAVSGLKSKTIPVDTAQKDSVFNYENLKENANVESIRSSSSFDNAKGMIGNTDSLIAKDTSLTKTISKTKNQMNRMDSLKRVYNQKAEEYRKQKAFYEGEINAKTKEANGYKDPSKLISLIPMKESQRKILEGLMAVKAFQVGNINPNYSKLYLSNGGMQGLNIEYNYKLLYVAGCVGKMLNIPPLSYNMEFLRSTGKGVFNFDNLIAGGRVGVGRIETNNLIVSAIYTKRNESDSLLIKNNQNLILSLAGNAKIKEFATLTAELAFSNPHQAGSYNVEPKYYFAVNSAATAAVAVLVPEVKTKIKAEYSRIAPGFVSGSQPFLRNDREDIKVKVEQPFLKSKVRVSSLFNYQRSNLSGSSNYKTSFYTYGGDVQFYFPKYPLIKVGYLGYQLQQKQTSESTQPNVQSNFSNAYVLLVYNSTIKKVALNQTLNVNLQYSKAFNQKNVSITYTGSITHKSSDYSINVSTTRSLSDNNFNFTDVSAMYSFTHKKIMVSSNIGVMLRGQASTNMYNNTSVQLKLNQFKIGLTNRLYTIPSVFRTSVENILQFQFAWLLNQKL